MKTGSPQNGAPVTLIVGGDGLIGKALLEHLRLSGSPVLGTTRREEQAGDSFVCLDLAGNVDDWRCPFPIDVAVICAGVTRLGECRRDPAASFRVNVEGIPALARKLVEGGAFVIYLSTNQVFDGETPYRRTQDPLSPITEYGRQKAEAENRIAAMGDSIAIVRLSKVLAPHVPLFAGWREALRTGESITPFSDMVMAPVPLTFAVSVLRVLADRKLPGIFHVSGGRDISYAEAAYVGASLIGANADLVRPITTCQSGLDAEAVPTHTTLNVESTRYALGLEPPEVGATIAAAFGKSILPGGKVACFQGRA